MCECACHDDILLQLQKAMTTLNHINTLTPLKQESIETPAMSNTISSSPVLINQSGINSNACSGSAITNDNHVTVWYGNKQPEYQSWKQLPGEYQIQMDRAGNYNVLVPRQGDKQLSQSWYQRLWVAVSNTVYECKVTASAIYPFVQFSMMCVAVIQEHPDSNTFGLVVICGSSSQLVQHTGINVVGGTIKPKMVKPGR